MARSNRPEVIERANATYETRPAKKPVMHQHMVRAFRAGQTLSVFGGPGIGKTKQAETSCLEILPTSRVIVLDGPTTTIENLVLDNPRKVDADGDDIVLDAALAEEFRKVILPDGSIQPYWIILDDINQMEDRAAQNVLLQIKFNGTLQQFDLKENGLVGVIELNNDSLSDTAQITTDLAALDRVTSVTVTAKDTDWRWALSQKYATVDLSEVFGYWATLPVEIRTGLPPRVLDHVLYALLKGYPGIVGMPFDDNTGEYRALGTTDGEKFNDRTEEIISKIAAFIGAPNPKTLDHIVERAVRDAYKDKLTILIEGEPGGGKTSLVQDIVRDEFGLDPMACYFSIPTTDPTRFFLPLPRNGFIKPLLTEPFARPGDKVAILDESNRGKKAMHAMLMAFNCDHRIGGRDVPGLRAVINIQNPQQVMGRKMTVTRRNRAQSERFTLNIKLNKNSINSDDWLLTVFPEKWADRVTQVETLSGEEITPREESVATARHIIETVLEWYKEDLDNEGRQWVSSRGKERLARHLLVDGDPDEAIIHLEPGVKAPVITAGLRHRLEKKTLTSLQSILADKAAWIQRIEDGKSAVAVHGTADTDLVQRVLEQAALTVLEENFDDIVDILKALPEKHRQAHLGSSPDKAAFWVRAMLEMKARYSKPQA